MKPKHNSRRALCDKQDNTQILPPSQIAKVAIGPSDLPQIDKQKLYSCIYKLVPQACLFAVVPIPGEQADPQLMIEATHIIQPPVTPSGNLTDQTGDLEQPNTCVTTDQASLELNTLNQNVYHTTIINGVYFGKVYKYN